MKHYIEKLPADYLAFIEFSAANQEWIDNINVLKENNFIIPRTRWYIGSSDRHL